MNESLLDRIIKLSPDVDLFDLVLKWTGKIYSEYPEHNGLHQVTIVEDAVAGGMRYYLAHKKPTLIITKGWFATIENGADFMALLKLQSSLRQDKWIKEKTTL